MRVQSCHFPSKPIVVVVVFLCSRCDRVVGLLSRYLYGKLFVGFVLCLVKI